MKKLLVILLGLVCLVPVVRAEEPVSTVVPEDVMRVIPTFLEGYVNGEYTLENIHDPEWVQDFYIREQYYRYVESFGRLQYGRGNVLGQITVIGDRLNRSDCGGLIIGYMINLGLIDNRNAPGVSRDGGSLDSYRLFRLGTLKKRSEAVRGDFLYFERESGVRHIAVSCDDGAKTMYDLASGKAFADCRPTPSARLMLVSNNGIVDLAKKNEIVLDEVKEIIRIFTTPTEEEAYTIIAWAIQIKDKQGQNRLDFDDNNI